MTPAQVLRNHGIVRIDPLTSGETADILEHLSHVSVFNGHVKNKGNLEAASPLEAVMNGWPAFSCSMEDIVTAPHMLELAMSIKYIAEEYFGEPPSLYSMNAFWTNPSAQTYMDTHSWHRDADDRKQMVLFVYGTDIEVAEDGAHLYIPGSHCKSDGEIGYDQNQTRFITEVPPHVTVLGPAGTAFLADTFGMHMGIRPRKPRLLLWARWGVTSPPVSYLWDQLAPVPRERLGDRYPTDPAMQEAIRLVVC